MRDEGFGGEKYDFAEEKNRENTALSVQKNVL